jgi:hypothetical protein
MRTPFEFEVDYLLPATEKVLLSDNLAGIPFAQVETCTLCLLIVDY